MQPPDQKLLCFLWRMGNTESFRSVADRFGLSKSSLHHNMSHVTEALLLQSSAYIKWPETDFQQQSITKGFHKIPGVIGCVDGTYIPMTGKSGDKRDAYICRKGFASMHAQITCTDKLVITDITTGFPGSVHDARVFRNSSLYATLHLLPMQYHILGDSAYPTQQYIKNLIEHGNATYHGNEGGIYLFVLIFCLFQVQSWLK